MKFAKCKTPKKLISSLYSPTMRKEPANPLETPSAVFWRQMCRKYLPISHCNPRFQGRGLHEFIDRRYRRCCRYQREQRVVLTDERFGRLIGELVEIQSCWSYFELRIRVSQGRFKNMALKVGKDVTEIRLAKPTPLSPTLF